jgi:chitinase
LTLSFLFFRKVLSPMRNSFIPSAVIMLFLIAGPAAASIHADWPARVVAPYMYAGSGDHFQLTACDDACSQKFYTLAFIIADKSNNPAWDGRIPMNKYFYADQIAAIRKRGGDVIISFGGEAGRELALVETNVEALQAKYQSVIDLYHFTWLDFDIEGRGLENTEANQRRNAALAKIQAENP